MKRKFEVIMTVTTTLEIDEVVINRCVNNEDGFKNDFYSLDTPEEVAQFLAYNMVINNCDLSQIDGFANLSNSLVDYSYDVEYEGVAI